jgi:hypothetical protein
MPRQGDELPRQVDTDRPGELKWIWSDGTDVTDADWSLFTQDDWKRMESERQAPAPQVVTAKEGSPLGDYFQNLVPQFIKPDAPGAQFDELNSQQERASTGRLLEQLQQQAATGSGEWEKTLADATRSAQATASALGQSNPMMGYQSALTNIGNAQSAASQRASGQANVLRAQAKQDATAQQNDLLSSQGEQDIEQARLRSAALQQRRQTNNELIARAKAGAEGIAGASGSALMSDGGKVPGKAQVFGDDERNDTVPAMLSPGEIVVPRSMANNPEAAAEFARAVAQNRAPQKMADGGKVDTGLENQQGPNTSEALLMTFFPHVGIDQYYKRIGLGRQAASIENGGLLDSTSFDENRANTRGLMESLEGQGPSVTGQQITNASDDTIAGAMAQQQQRAAASEQASAMAQAVAAQQAAGGQTAATAGNEQSRRQQLLAKTATAQRGRDLAMALAQQQAGWRNTAMNAGIAADQQAQIMNAISGGAQAIASLSKARGGSSKKDPGWGDDNDDDSGYGEWNDSGDGQDAAFGGEILDSDEAERKKTASFLKALRRSAA